MNYKNHKIKLCVGLVVCKNFIFRINGGALTGSGDDKGCFMDEINMHEGLDYKIKEGIPTIGNMPTQIVVSINYLRRLVEYLKKLV